MQSIKCYHGTNGRFSQFEQSKARIPNDFYGGGVAYFTDSLDVAKTYATAASKRSGGDRFVYEVEAKFKKMFDVDEIYSGQALIDMIGNDVEQFARGARLLSLGGDRLTILSKLRNGNINLTGEQVFRGMSNGMISTARARERLIKLGYDGLRYNGGKHMNMQRHNVYLSYYADQIFIRQRFIVTSERLEYNANRETYTFIN